MSTTKTIPHVTAAPAWEEPLTRPSGPLIRITPCEYLTRQGWTSRILSLALLTLTLPIIAALYLLVRFTSPGPGFYRQVRVGKDGRIFVMYKLRSMIVDAEVGTGPVWTQDTADPRITRVGWLLRKSHLDELPQLINAVRGEMTLFGPRPERPELVHLLADQIPGYWDRLAVRPGITGLAQINLPPDTDIDSVRRKLTLDLEYIRMASYWMDVRMFLWTGLRLVAVPAKIATRWTGLERNMQPVATATTGPVSIADVIHRSTSIHKVAANR